MKEEKAKIRRFLKANGWTKIDKNSEYESWGRDNAVGVDFNDSGITFIGGSGDFASIRLDFYALVGFFYVKRLLLPVIPDGI